MDCEMPIMNGLTATREIRKMEASGELEGRHRILALTGNARAGQIRAALEAGMDDVIVSCSLLRMQGWS
jgi:CheY-like chemotaxis protein